MNVRKTLSVVVVLSLLLGGLGAAHAATTLPYAQSFEIPFPPDVHVTKIGSGNPAASEAAKLEGAGSKGLEIENAKVTLGVDGTYDNVWIQVYMKPVKGDPEDPEPNVTGQTGAFYINSTDNKLWANNGGIWQAQDGQLFENNKYYGFIVHANYGEGKYDIYSNDGTFKANMTRLNTDSLDFIAAAGNIATVSIQSGELAYVDALAVSRAFQSPGQATRVAVYHHQASQITEGEFQIPAYSAVYASKDSNRAIGGLVGLSILSGLVNGDEIRLWTTNSFGWANYRVSSGAFTSIGGDTPTATTNEPVTTMSRLLLDQTDTRADTFGFYPFTHTSVIALGGNVQPTTAKGSSETHYLNGVGTGQGQHPQGWTGLIFNESIPVSQLSFNSPSNFNVDDDLYVSLPSSPNNWNWYRWTGTGWQPRGGTLQTNTVPQGANMWVKRKSGIRAAVPVVYN